MNLILRHLTAISALILALAAISCDSTDEATGNTLTFPDNYPWSYAHRDSRNSDFVPVVSPDDIKQSWTALQGETFFMGPTVDPDGNVCVCSGGGPGTSHLHCFDKNGNLNWASKKMKDLNDLDYGVYVSAPVLGGDNDLYIADINQLWKFRAADGKIEWVVELDSLNIKGPGFSAFMISDSKVGYAFKDGNIAIFNREDGTLAYPVLQLPGVKGPPSSEYPEGMLKGLLYEPFIQFAWDAVWGLDMEISNTPCVSPSTGRIFVIATGKKSDETDLYGIDIKDGEMKIVFDTQIGSIGSGTSPTLSFDDRYVYVTDGKGRLNGVDAETGKVAWHSEETSITGVSPSTSPDGRVYTSDFNLLKCWDGSNGDIIWKADLTEDIGKPYFPKDYKIPEGLKNPAADIVSGVLVTKDRLWAVVQIVNKFSVPEENQGAIKIPIEGLDKSVYKLPLAYYIVSYDLKGKLMSVTSHPDVGALTAIGNDGRIYSTSMSVTSSIGYAVQNRDTFPEQWKYTPKPLGGLTVFTPKNQKAYNSKLSD